ncbi:hypothetical protein HDK90DRAFT_317935 [Phyllosticta capitalensis]|uniref:Uncharacterized protein n=1 Tax=Phyllosticta capitalensis TaxID=121624 RepID=A0ABR1YI87_9PEZI
MDVVVGEGRGGERERERHQHLLPAGRAPSLLFLSPSRFLFLSRRGPRRRSRMGVGSGVVICCATNQGPQSLSGVDCPFFLRLLQLYQQPILHPSHMYIYTRTAAAASNSHHQVLFVCVFSAIAPRTSKLISTSALTLAANSPPWLHPNSSRRG